MNRVLPRTEAQVENLLHAIKTKMGVVSPADMAITPATQTAITAKNTLFDGLVTDKAAALYVQTKSTKAAETAKAVDKMFISQYFQVFNFGVDRGKYDAESRVFYGIGIKDKTVPVMQTEAQILFWGGKIITGDSNRVAAGGAAMANPSAAEVGTTNGDYNTKFNTSGLDEEAFKTAEAALTAEMQASILLCVKALDEMQAFYSGMPVATIRDKIRGWGGIYSSDVVETINVHVVDYATGVMLPGANIEVIQSGTNHTTDAAGNAAIDTTIAFGVTLRVSLAGYVTQDVVVDFIAGQTVYNIVVKLVAI
jgi:hypothetical protein